jgi:hypothetical protein
LATLQAKPSQQTSTLFHHEEHEEHEEHEGGGKFFGEFRIWQLEGHALLTIAEMLHPLA